MKTILQQHFPMIRDREEVLYEIRSQKKFNELFDSWEQKYQEEFLDFCTGARGVKLLYDGFFKAVMDPESKPERLEELLSVLLKEKVKIMMILPNESARIAAESSLLILDIVVQLSDGSIANVEVQKIGYAFPG